MIIFGTVCAGLGISSLVCPANWSFFDKKELISLSVFLKEGNSSCCKEQRQEWIALLLKSESLLLPFLKSETSDGFKRAQTFLDFSPHSAGKMSNSLLKRANCSFITSESLLCSKKWKEWSAHFANRSCCSLIKEQKSKSPTLSVCQLSLYIPDPSVRLFWVRAGILVSNVIQAY